MTTHVATPFVKLFGNSVLFGDRLDSLPQFFQPLLFYPDWFFMTWPFHLYFSLVGNGNGVYMSALGSNVATWAVIWLIAGCLFGAFGWNETFQNIKNVQLPLLIRIPYRIVVYFLYWHIVMGDMIGTLLTANFWIGYDVSIAFRKIVLFCTIAPPVIGIVWCFLISFGVHFSS